MMGKTLKDTDSEKEIRDAFKGKRHAFTFFNNLPQVIEQGHE